MEERCGVELDVLHIDATGAGPVGHRNAIAAGAGRIGGMQKDATQSSRRQDRLLREDGKDLSARLVQYIRPNARRMFIDIKRFDRMVRNREQINCGGRAEQLDLWIRGHLFDERALDRRSGPIFLMQDTWK